MEKNIRLESSYTLINPKYNIDENPKTKIENTNNSDLSRMLKRSHTNRYEGPLGHDKCFDNRLDKLNIFEMKTKLNKIVKISGDNNHPFDEDSPRKYIPIKSAKRAYHLIKN
jgi:hypothetical protein